MPMATVDGVVRHYPSYEEWLPWIKPRTEAFWMSIRCFTQQVAIFIVITDKDIHCRTVCQMEVNIFCFYLYFSLRLRIISAMTIPGYSIAIVKVIL